MNSPKFTSHHVETARHRTTWIEAGPSDGTPLIFLHGWPELGLVWRAQIERFAARGWRCVAPDMRGYGDSSVPTATNDYSTREIVADMCELHDALGGAPAVWVGHDWGSPIVWGLAAHHAERCRGVANICVPYLARGFALANMLPLIDRELYPAATHPFGQWDYFLFYRENFARAAHDLEADVAATIAVLYRATAPDVIGKPAITANIRAQDGWFGPAHRAPQMPRDETMLSQSDYDAMVAAFNKTGFLGANAWYMNDADNLAYAGEAPDFGRLSLPVLFLHADWDTNCDTVRSPLADPMRADCADLTEVHIAGGHELQLQCPDEVNAVLEEWLNAKKLGVQN